MGIAIGSVIGVPFYRPINWSRYWAGHLFGQDDLNLWVKKDSRSGLTLTDSINPVNNVNILTPTYRGSGVLPLSSGGGVLERFFDGNSYTLYCKLKMLSVYTAGTQFDSFIKMGSDFDESRGLSIKCYNRTLYINIGDGTTRLYFALINNVDTTMINAGWCEVFTEVDFVTKRVRCSIYKISDSGLLGSSSNLDISGYTYNNNNNATVLTLAEQYAHFAFADLKKFVGLKTIAQCRDNTYITDLQFYYPTIFDGTDVSVNVHHLTIPSSGNIDAMKYYSNISTYCLDKGYSDYQQNNSVGTPALKHIFIPYDLDGIPIVRVMGTGITLYLHIKDVNGDLINHNLYDSLLEFTGANWDRSDVIIFSDLARGTGTYYDATSAATKKRFHISELNYIVSNGYYNAGYRGLNFVKINNNSTDDRQLLTDIIGYITDKTGNDLNKVLQYCGDYTVPKTYNKGQLIITFDDSNHSQYIYALPILKTKDVKATFYIIGQKISTSDNTYLTWDEVQEMYQIDMDIQCHSYDHANLTTLTQAEVLAELTDNNAIFNVNGLINPDHIAYPYGAYDANVKTWVATLRKTGRIVGAVDVYINQVLTLDKFEINSIGIDAFTDANIITLKALLENARITNKIVILYCHNVDPAGAGGAITTAHFEEIIDYAQSIGIDIITMAELYALML